MTLHPDMTVDHFTFTIVTGWNMSTLFPFFLSERAKYMYIYFFIARLGRLQRHIPSKTAAYFEAAMLREV